MPVKTSTLPNPETTQQATTQAEPNPYLNGQLLFAPVKRGFVVLMEPATSYLPEERDRLKFPQRTRKDMSLPMRETAFELAANAFGLVPPVVEFYNSLPEPLVEDIPHPFSLRRGPKTITYWSALRCLAPYESDDLLRGGLRKWIPADEVLRHTQHFKEKVYLKVLTMLPPVLG